MSPEKTCAPPHHKTPQTSDEPAGIYVHIPFCESKCPYCSFISFAGHDAAFRSSYMQALGRQAAEMAAHPWSRNRRFHSLFIGGGTPSVLDPGQLAGFIAACRTRYDYITAPGNMPEITVELNPNTVNIRMLQLLKEAGVNRLSLGMQAFSDVMLRNIGRKHTVEDNIRAFAWARGAGFTNINLDLMYGLPGQDESAWEKSLEQAAALSPEHFSVYELTIEPGTLFAQRAETGRLDLPPEDVTAAMFEMARTILSARGYEQYEISNYARPGFACRHNITYWENGSYIGLGAGAVSCFSGIRIKNVEDPTRYIQLLDRQQAPFAEAEFLPLQARFRETVIMGLRLTEGVRVSHLAERFGLTPQTYYGDQLQKLLQQKLLEERSDRLRLTRRGLLLANRVMAQLV